MHFLIGEIHFLGSSILMYKILSESRIMFEFHAKSRLTENYNSSSLVASVEYSDSRHSMIILESSYHIVCDVAMPIEATPSIFNSIADSVWFSDISKFWDYHFKGPKKSLPSSKIFFAPPPPKIQEKKRFQPTATNFPNISPSRGEKYGFLFFFFFFFFFGGGWIWTWIEK